MSASGLTSEYYNPHTLDGLTIIEADELIIGGNNIDITTLVPYQGANQTVDLNSQVVKTTHTAVTNSELVNLGLLNTTISNLSIAISGTFLDKVTLSPQTVIGNVSYTAELSADDLLVPATKRASLGSVLSINANYTTTATDAGVITRQYFGSITSSMGVYQATSTQNFAILQCADLGTGTGKRMDINWNLNINEPLYNSSIQLFASSDGVTINQYLGPSVSFVPSDPLYRVLFGTFVPQYRYLCILCLTSAPSGIQTVRWYGLDIDEQGVELTNVTMPSLTADRVAVFNGNKQLVSSGINVTKLNTLDNVSSDIQTQLNSKLNLSGSNADQDIILGAYKVQSTATPIFASDLTNKDYVDTAILSNLTVIPRRSDVRTGVAPIIQASETMSWYFGTHSNNGVTPYSDLILLNGWDDPSGGKVNLISFNKGTAGGIRQFQGTHGSVSNFSDYFDCVMTDLNSSNVTLSGNLAMGANTVTSSTNPTTDNMLTRKGWVDGQLSLKANLSGGNTFSGNQTFNSGTISISSRLIGEPDSSPTGNFWIGLRGTGSEIQRLAISINGNYTTGDVTLVSISKTLRLTQPSANRVLTLNSDGDVVSSTVTPTVLAYLDVASSVQGLLNTKANLAGGNTFTGTQTYSDQTASTVAVFNGSKNLVSSTVTTTSLGYLDATSSIQGQLNGKLNDTGDTSTGILNVDIANAYASRASNPLPSNFVAKSTSARLYMGAYYTGGAGVAGTIQVSDFYVDGGVDKDHGADLLLNPLGGRIGIGTSSPGSLLHMYNDGTFQLQLQSSAVDNNYITSANDLFGFNANLSLSGVPNVGRGSAQILLQCPTSASFIQFMTNSTVNTIPSERMRITGTGNIGIGTTSPAGKLSVANAGSMDFINLQNTSYVFGQFINQRFLFGTSAGTNRSAYIQSALTTGNKTNFLFYTDAGAGTVSEKFRITGDGNIGIGTDPSTKLHIYNDGAFQTRFQTSGVDSHFINSFYEGFTLNANFSLTTIPNTGRGSSQIILQTPAGAGGNIQFMVGDAVNTAPTERMRITADGNVGIGSTAPQKQLDVTATNLSCVTGTQIYGSALLNATYGVAGSKTGDAGILLEGGTNYNLSTSLAISRFLNGSRTEIMRIGEFNGAYNVGIGTNSPNATLHVWGSSIFANYNPYQFANHTFSNASGSTSLAITASDEYTDAILYLGTPHIPTVASGSAYKTAIIAKANGSWSTADLHFCLNGTTGSNDISQSASVAYSKMVIKSSSGNVGVGTTDPGYKLDVNGTGRIRNELYVGTEGNTSSTIFMGGVVGDDPYSHCQIKCRKYNEGGEGSELILFKGNDIQAGSLVPDRVRLRGANICFDTYPSYSSDPDALNIRMTISQDGQSFHTAGDNSYMRYGPNTTWGSYLHVGATTNKVGQPETAQVITTNGNLHLDSGYDRDIYLNYYSNQAGRAGTIYSYGTWAHNGSSSFLNNVGIGTASPTGRLDVYSTTADYTNSVVVRTPWASVVLDNTQITSGRKWSILSGGVGAGIGTGNLGIYDITGGAYRFNILSDGRTMIGGNTGHAKFGISGGNITGNVYTPGAWPANANGMLITEGQPNANSSALYVGHQNDGGFITSLQPSVAWNDILISAAVTQIYCFGVLVAYSDPTGWINISDEREKDDIQPLKTDKSLQRILALRPTHYRRRFTEDGTPVPQEHKQKRLVGFVAQEVLQSNPHCVSKWCKKSKGQKKQKQSDIFPPHPQHSQERKEQAEEEEEEPEEEPEEEQKEPEEERLGLNYNDYLVHLVGAVQELHAKHELGLRKQDEQQKQIEEQQKRVKVLEEREVMWEKHAREQEAKMKKMERDMEKMAGLLSQLISK